LTKLIPEQYLDLDHSSEAHSKGLALHPWYKLASQNYYSIPDKDISDGYTSEKEKWMSGDGDYSGAT
jgi:hypothetical protein